MTVTIQIGNSDDKLSQKEWAEFVRFVKIAIKAYDGEIHFFGAPANHSPWQNAAWIVEAPVQKLTAIRQYLTQIKKDFRQDSIAWTEGKTEFI